MRNLKTYILLIFLAFINLPGFSEYIEPYPSLLASYEASITQDEVDSYIRLIATLKEQKNANFVTQRIQDFSKKYNIDFWGPLLVEDFIRKKETQIALEILSKFPHIINIVPVPDCGTLLGISIEQNDSKMFEALVKLGANVNGQDLYGFTPIYIAASKGQVEFAKRLVELGANVNHPNIMRMTPLEIAIFEKHNEMIFFLIDSGADLSPKDRDFYRQPLFLATQQKNKELIEYLLKKGVPINDQINDGETVLFSSFQNDNDFDFFLWLISKGADPLIKTKNGNTLLHKAARTNSIKIAKFLIDSGLPINYNVLCGYTPLHRAAEGNCKEMYEFLLRCGADPKIKNKAGFFPDDLWPQKALRRDFLNNNGLFK